MDYGGRVDMANLCNAGLYAAHEKKVPVPSAVRVRPFTEEGDNPRELAYYDAGLGAGAGTIVINGNHPAWRDMARYMCRANLHGIQAVREARKLCDDLAEKAQR